MSWWYVGVTIGSTIHSSIEQDKSRKATREASNVEAEASRRQATSQRRIANIKAQRDRTKAFREARKTRGTAIAQEQTSGTSSSATKGFIGSVTSQTASGIGAGQTISAIATETSIFNVESSRQAQSLYDVAGVAQGRAATATAVGSAASIFSPKGGVR